MKLCYAAAASSAPKLSKRVSCYVNDSSILKTGPSLAITDRSAGGHKMLPTSTLAGMSFFGQPAPSRKGARDSSKSVVRLSGPTFSSWIAAIRRHLLIVTKVLGGWGRLSDDGSRQHNSDKSEDLGRRTTPPPWRHTVARLSRHSAGLLKSLRRVRKADTNQTSVGVCREQT